MSTYDLEKALAIVRSAIHNEVSGQRFYHDAAYYCIDLWAKEIFADLAREEEEHTRLLLLAYETLTTQGHWVDLEAARASNVEVDITRFDFPPDEPAEALFPFQWTAAEAIDRRSDDLSALAFGIGMETRAIEQYSQAGKTSQDPAAREAYRFLVEEETRHYLQLKAHWEKLAGRAFQDQDTDLLGLETDR